MMRRQCMAQGFGRLAAAEAETLAVADIAAAEAMLAGPFLFGAEPTSFDACLYAFLATSAAFPVDGAMRRRVLGSPELVDYLNLMESLCGFGTSGR
jgi:glutathione S-transferase